MVLGVVGFLPYPYVFFPLQQPLLFYCSSWRNTLPRDRLELNQVYTCFRLLVGAPKEKAESGLSANETGDVYACQMTAESKDCKRLNLLNSSNFPANHMTLKFAPFLHLQYL